MAQRNNTIMLRVIMQNVLYAECRYAKCRGAFNWPTSKVWIGGGSKIEGKGFK